MQGSIFRNAWPYNIQNQNNFSNLEEIVWLWFLLLLEFYFYQRIQNFIYSRKDISSTCGHLLRDCASTIAQNTNLIIDSHLYQTISKSLTQHERKWKERSVPGGSWCGTETSTVCGSPRTRYRNADIDYCPLKNMSLKVLKLFKVLNKLLDK